MASPAYSDGPFSWGPKCAKLAGFTPDAYRKQIEQPGIDPRQMALIQDAPVIHPGHKHKAPGIDSPLIAIEPKSGAWRMREICGEWLGNSHLVFAEDVAPMPMKYYNGQIPS